MSSRDLAAVVRAGDDIERCKRFGSSGLIGELKGKGESAGTHVWAFKVSRPLPFGQPPGRNCSCNCLPGSRPLHNAARAGGCSSGALQLLVLLNWRVMKSESVRL